MKKKTRSITWGETLLLFFIALLSPFVGVLYFGYLIGRSKE